MKRIKGILAIVVMAVVVMANCSVAQAAEGVVTVESAGNLRVEELTPEELAMLPAPAATNASYTAHRYTETFNFSIEGTRVASADAECIVWHYTDGKVHLYSRTIDVSRLSTYYAGRSYGQIVNTDGSYSYTTGDRVGVYSDAYSWIFALDFHVTPNNAYFDCYEI